MSGTNFFDFREQIVGKKKPPEKNAADAMSVAELTALIDRAIRSGVPASVLVKGEISNLSPHRASGHLYFTLKDGSACIDCVMFKSDAARLKFDPADGMELLAGGRVGIYAQRGRYQLYVTSLSPIGQGALELAFQQLRAKLEAEGLFAPERKRPLPNYPRHIVLLTSRHTAALQDILKVLRKFAFLHLMVCHVSVQGEGSAEQIAAAIDALNKKAGETFPIDLILLARGGGSLEDLWEFNEEIVARAMAKSRLPIVTGIGHEVDVSIADLVADYHAHTPTEAAQVVSAQWRNARDGVAQQAVRLRRAVQQQLAEARQRLTAIERHELFRRPTDRINQLRQLLDDRQRALVAALGNQLHRAESRLEKAASRLGDAHPRHRIRLHEERLNSLSILLKTNMTRLAERLIGKVNAYEAQLRALSPQEVLKRGYSMTTLKKSGKIIRRAEEVKPGERLVTRFADGTVESVAEDQQQLPLFE